MFHMSCGLSVSVSHVRQMKCVFLKMSRQNVKGNYSLGVTECMLWNCVIRTQKKGNSILAKLQKNCVIRLQMHEIIYRITV